MEQRVDEILSEETAEKNNSQYQMNGKINNVVSIYCAALAGHWDPSLTTATRCVSSINYQKQLVFGCPEAAL